MRIVFFGSGAFGLPTLRALARRHDIALVVSQPPRPAGRSRKPTPTPIAEVASSRDFDIITPERINDAAVVEPIRAVDADAWVVIAYGQKLGSDILEGRFAINLHGSLLPRYRGAAPINWAIINGEKSTGLSVITLAQRMDAGDILGQVETPIDPFETAGELHDRLAALGPDLVEAVLGRFETGILTRQPQEETAATFAPKLSKADGTVDFARPAAEVRSRIHGLTPWPGCRVMLGDQAVRLHRAKVIAGSQAGGQEGDAGARATPGTLLDGEAGIVACGQGAVQLLAVHPAGGNLMSFSAFARGRRIDPSTLFRPVDSE